jgi:hypothetical protein
MDGSGRSSPARTISERLIGQRVARQRVLQLGHRADIAGVQSVTGSICLTQRTPMCAKPFRGLPVRDIDQRYRRSSCTPDITLKYVIRARRTGSAVVLNTTRSADLCR